MKKLKKLLMLLVALVFYDVMLAQVTPPRAVVSSIGKDTVVCNLAWSYTVGEAVINSYSFCNLKLTQGFQQPDIANCGGYHNKTELPVSIYPNPAKANSLLTFSLPPEENGAVSVSIYDAAGRLAKSMTLPTNKAGSKYNFQPEVSAAGMYRVSITTNESIYNGMFLISN